MPNIRNVEQYRDNSLGLLEDNDLLHYPIDLALLADKLNIELKYIPLDDDISGKIEYSPNQENDLVITIDSNENQLRQNFSLAHEIAHYIHDIDFNSEHVEIEDQRTFLRSSTINPIERRANKYAERLLMPKDLFNDRTNELKDEFFPELGNKLGVKNIYRIVSQLSEDFAVSKPAVIMRLASIKKIKPGMKSSLFDYHSF